MQDNRPETRSEERRYLEQTLAGASQGLTGLRESLHSKLFGILVHRGATDTEAEDLLADFWSDCVPGNPDKPSILEKYRDHLSLCAWMATILTNRWVDSRRRNLRRNALVENRFQEHPEAAPPHSNPLSESYLGIVLRETVRSAFLACPGQAQLILKLIYLHGLTQREVATMWGWHESKVSRYISTHIAQVRLAIETSLKKRDPWLELHWEDILEICDYTPIPWITPLELKP